MKKETDEIGIYTYYDLCNNCNMHPDDMDKIFKVLIHDADKVMGDLPIHIKARIYTFIAYVYSHKVGVEQEEE